MEYVIRESIISSVFFIHTNKYQTQIETKK